MEKKYESAHHFTNTADPNKSTFIETDDTLVEAQSDLTYILWTDLSSWSMKLV